MQDEFRIKENLILNAGVRYDYFKNFKENISPRAGIIYRPFDKTTLKFIYGEAFRIPNAYELYYNDGNTTQKVNPDLDPERIQTYEFIIEQYHRNLRFSASGFYYRARELIAQTIDPLDGLLVFKNIDDVEAKGVEFETKTEWENGMEARINYTFQQTNNRETGRLLPNSPKHMIKTNFFIPIIRRMLSAGIEIQYLGKRKTISGTYTGGAFITNLNFLSQEILKGLEISGTIYNLLNKKYGFPASGEHIQRIIEQDGRSFRLKLTYAF